MHSCKGTWVLGETDERSAISRACLELLSLGRRLADDTSEKLSVVFIGPNIRQPAEESIRFGSDRTYILDDPSLPKYNPDSYVSALETLCKHESPGVLLASHTALGQDLFPRLAARLKTGVVTDCVNLAVDRESGAVLMTKPVFGGNALAVYACKSHPQMATVRAGVGGKPECRPNRTGEIIEVEVAHEARVERTKSIEKIKEKIEGVKLEDAEVVVSGGRGIGGAQGFRQLHELAKLLGGTVGASRPACDMGWMPSSSQVGLTGRIVAPKIYFAVAISGAMQHLTGMSESKHVVAINTDATANIFKFSDYGVVGDYKVILPSLVEKLSVMLGRNVRTDLQ
jgi:electron transfer flavoprotein alpha subunit